MRTTIRSLRAREIFDSRGQPTIEADVLLEHAMGRASVPSGTSTGTREALERRDGDPARLAGRGVLTCVALIQADIADGLRGVDAADQGAVDRRLIDLDGTPNKARLGANTVLAVSMAAARAAADAAGLPLHRHLTTVWGTRPNLPIPMVNVINGGAHAATPLEFEEFMLVPRGAASLREALCWTSEVLHSLKASLQHIGHITSFGDEGGFAPDFWTAEEALAAITHAIGRARFRPGPDMGIAIDVAAGGLYRRGAYEFPKSQAPTLTTEQMIETFERLCDRFPVMGIEDGLADVDEDGWRRLTERLSHRALVIGDDLFATNPEAIQRGVREGLATALVIKPNQVGTVSEAAAAVRAAQAGGWQTIVGSRSGDTEDTFIADFAVAAGATFLKAGSLARSERVAKYNQLLRIEAELGASAWSGAASLREGAGA